MKDIFKPLLLGRSFLAWTHLLICIAIIIVTLYNYLIYTKLMIAISLFIAGCNFVVWSIDTVIQSQNRLLEVLFINNEKLLKLHENKINLNKSKII